MTAFDPAALIAPAGILGGVGLVFGTLIAIAHRYLKVWEDPRIDVVTDLLPGANCGACGFAGCRAFAEGVIEGRTQPAACTVSSPDGIVDIAAFLGVDAGAAVKRVARLLCAGGSHVALQRARYRGLATCSAAAAVAGGGKACTWGCLGLADCQVACDFDAISMTPEGLALVDPERCTACGDCVEACPKDLFVLMPVDRRLIVQCRSLLEGDAAEDICQVACTACGRCAQDAPPGVIDIRGGLAVVNYERNAETGPAATARCPTGAIVWLEGSTQPLLPAGKRAEPCSS